MSDAMDVDVGSLEIRFQPVKLWDLAAVSLATAFLRYKITYVRQNGAKGAKINALELAHVSVPTCIRKTIDELYCNFEKSWMSWWYYHHRRIFLQQPSPDSMIDWLDHMIWLPNGTINYEQTAKRILFGDMLTKVQKFQLACVYCFMDDVERLKTELAQEEIEYACSGYNKFRNGFANYWSCRMRKFSSLHEASEEGDLPDIIFLFLLFAYDKSSTLEPYDEWSAMEFWINTCRFHDVSKRIPLIAQVGAPRVIFNFLITLTAFELNSLIENHFLHIMKGLVQKRNYEYTILIWKHVVHGISDDDLASILKYLDYNEYRYDQKYVNSLLLEMWLCTSERQKKYIINERVCDFTKRRPYSSEIEKFPPNFPLILDFLSHCDLERKYEYWLENWPYLVIPQLGSENQNIIDGIMKLCLVDDQKIEDFKRAKMTDCYRIANYCQWFIQNGRINEIQSYLEFCTSDLQLIRDLKKKIITYISNHTIFDILFCGSDEKKRDLFQYLDDVFTENESKEFLNKIVTCPSNLQQFCHMIGNVTSLELNYKIEILEKYVSSEQNLFKAKQYIFKQCYGEAKISIFFDLIRWCLNVDKLVIENFESPSSRDESNVGSSNQGRIIMESEMNDGRLNEDSIVEESDDQMRNSGHYIFDIFMSPYYHREV